MIYPASRSVSWHVPVETPNPLNNSHGHWRVKQARGAEQHEQTVTLAPRDARWRLPVVVVLRRYYCAPRKLDRDGLAAALKYVTDGVAEVVGADDGDEANFRVQYEQERVPHRHMVGVLVTVIQGARVVETLELLEAPA